MSFESLIHLIYDSNDLQNSSRFLDGIRINSMSFLTVKNQISETCSVKNHYLP